MIQINPMIDCVAKAILGDPKHKRLLIHFLNAILEKKDGEKIKDVEILNPYNEKEFSTDKLSILDIKATDDKSDIFQIEIQIKIYPSLAKRILYTWARCTTSRGTRFRFVEAGHLNMDIGRRSSIL